MPIKLALLDDHELVLEGIKNTLQKEPSFSIIGAFTKPTPPPPPPPRGGGGEAS